MKIATASTLTRFIAAYILISSFTGCLIIAMVDYVRMTEIPSTIATVIFGLLMSSASVIGIHLGVGYTNGPATEIYKATILQQQKKVLTAGSDSQDTPGDMVR